MTVPKFLTVDMHGIPHVLTAVPEPSTYAMALTTLRTLPPPPSDREYTPARSAGRHRPETNWRRLSILSPVVTATGTTFWAA